MTRFVGTALLVVVAIALARFLFWPLGTPDSEPGRIELEENRRPRPTAHPTPDGSTETRR